MDTRGLPQHRFYEPVAPVRQPSGSDSPPAGAASDAAPALPHARSSQQRTAAPRPGYQLIKDEIKQILLGVVAQLINPKWWLYGLLEELGAPKSFLKKFKGLSDIQIRTAILRSQLTRSKRFEILKRDGYTCHYCHRTNVPLEVDHMVPLYKGGKNDDSNLVAAWHECNHSKGIQDA